MTVTFSGEIHPAAAIWPMLPEADLRRLAEDIAANGLRHPIVLDADGRIVDGKNRLAACQIAEVEPTFEKYDGDPVALVLSENNERNHLSTGQRAMATAMTLQTQGKRRNGRWQRGSVPSISQDSDLSKKDNAWRVAMGQAGVVLDHAPDLAPLVVSGGKDGKTLDAAYREAEENRAKAERVATLGSDIVALVESGVIDLDEAERRAAFKARYDELPPDLQQRVDDGLDINEAEVVVRDREQRIQAQAQTIGGALSTFTRMAGNPIPAELSAALTDSGFNVAAVTVVIKALEKAGYGSTEQ